MSEATTSFSEGYNNPMGQGFSNFGSKSALDGSKEFLMSNTLVAKLAFLLLVMIVFFLLLRIMIQIIVWWNQPDPNPYLVTCRRDGERSMEISSNPKMVDSVPILRSKDERAGTEFTWSLWVFVKSPHHAEKGHPAYYHVFHKGTKATTGVLSKINHDVAPGLYIKAEQDGEGNIRNSLVSVINTFKGGLGKNFDGLEKETVLENIPFGKWIHVAIRIENKNFDTYINGILAKRRALQSLPRQNYGNTHISQAGSLDGAVGFKGEISSLRYFNSALNPVEINSITNSGPNMCADDSTKQYPPYFSQRWYL